MPNTASAALVDELVRQCDAAGLAPEDLDDAVHDAADAEASDRYNDGEGPDFGEPGSDDLHDAVSQSASDANNDGLPSQIEYLLARLGETGTREVLRALPGR